MNVKVFIANYNRQSQTETKNKQVTIAKLKAKSLANLS